MQCPCLTGYSHMLHSTQNTTHGNVKTNTHQSVHLALVRGEGSVAVESSYTWCELNSTRLVSNSMQLGTHEFFRVVYPQCAHNSTSYDISFPLCIWRVIEALLPHRHCPHRRTRCQALLVGLFSYSQASPSSSTSSGHQTHHQHCRTRAHHRSHAAWQHVLLILSSDPPIVLHIILAASSSTPPNLALSHTAQRHVIINLVELDAECFPPASSHIHSDAQCSQHYFKHILTINSIIDTY
jgi:hypothetical protein